MGRLFLLLLVGGVLGLGGTPAKGASSRPQNCAVKLRQCPVDVSIPPSGPPPAPAVWPFSAGPPGPLSEPCAAADFAALSGVDLVEAIATGSTTCLGVLWSFDADVATVVDATNVALAAATVSSEATALSTHVERITALSYFLQIAFYHEFYQSSVAYDGATVAAAQQAMADVAASADFWIESSAMDDLREQWTITIDSTNATHLVVDTIQMLLERYVANPALSAVYQERSIVYGCLFTLSRQIGNQYAALGVASPWYDLLSPAFTDVVRAIALDTGYDANTEFLVLNALWVAGHFSYLNANTALAGQQILTDALTVFGHWTSPYLRALMDLETFYGSELSDGTVLNMDQLRDDARVLALPNQFAMDQGQLRFETGVDFATVQQLYDAIQEVDSQFFRLTALLDPVPGDGGAVLNLVIYATPAEYEKWQPFLSGLDTDNGGIFIESDATLYTYQRTPAQSSYTLEELLRHEYTHYLASRYVIVGSFGETGTLYEGNRLVWCDEGLAEYLAGSTRIQGVPNRRVLIADIADDASWMTVSEILHATYDGGFTFYRYAALMMGFLVDQRPEQMVSLVDTIRRNDRDDFDALIAVWSNDGALAADYQGYLTERVNGLSAGLDIYAEDVPNTPTPAGLPVGNIAVMRTALDQDAPRSTGTMYVWPDRFAYVDHLFWQPAGSEPEMVRAELDALVDDTLRALALTEDNFVSAVGWFGNIEQPLDGTLATYVIEGPFRVDMADQTPPSPPGELSASLGGTAAVLRWRPSTADDLAGYRVYAADQSQGPYTLRTPVPVRRTLYADDVAPSGIAYYVVAAVDGAGNESSPSNEVSVSVPVLLVNGYFEADHFTYVDAYRNALERANIPYFYWDPFEAGDIPDSVLDGFVGGVVIWVVGYCHSAYPDQLSAARQAALERYLDQGGNLVLSGAYTSSYWDGLPLFADYVQVSHVQYGPGLSALKGVGGNPVGDALSLTVSTNYQSEIDMVGNAQSALVYDVASGSGTIQSSGTAVATVDGVFKVAYLAFPFHEIVLDGQDQLLSRVVEWMLPGQCFGVDTDRDGRPDRCDLCAGFSDWSDLDWDGVPNGCDRCPTGDDTLDADADTVPDGCDVCPGGDDGLDVDADGVPDGCDQCAGHDDGLDVDVDGVPDGCDQCAGHDDGLDGDADGVPDGCDLCPGEDDATCVGCDGVPGSGAVLDRCGVCNGDNTSCETAVVSGPSDRGCGCGSRAGGSPGWGWLVALTLFSKRRRGRHCDR